MHMLQHGDPNGSVWRPGETDVSIRPGWFNHAAEDARVRTIDDLVSLYFTSVGRNSKLLLNVPPTREGLLNEVDVSRITGMHEQLGAMFAHDLASGRALRWQANGAGTELGQLDLGGYVTVSVADLGEDIAHGQRIARYRLEGETAAGWR